MSKCKCGNPATGIAVQYFHDGGLCAVEISCADCVEAQNESYLYRKAAGWTTGIASEMRPQHDFHPNTAPIAAVDKLNKLFRRGEQHSELFWRIVEGSDEPVSDLARPCCPNCGSNKLRQDRRGSTCDDCDWDNY